MTLRKCYDCGNETDNKFQHPCDVCRKRRIPSTCWIPKPDKKVDVIHRIDEGFRINEPYLN